MRVTGLNELKMDTALFGPVERHLADVLRTVVTANHRRQPSPPDQLIERSDDLLQRRREIDFDSQRFAVEIVQHIEQPNRSAVVEPVVHEVHRPHFVDAARHGQRLRLLAHQALARFDAHTNLTPGRSGKRACALRTFWQCPMASIRLQHGYSDLAERPYIGGAEGVLTKIV